MHPAFAAFSFSTMAWANVNTASLAPYDTVVLMISTETVPLNATQQENLINWVHGGGKLIMYDSETVPTVDYSWLPYSMTTKNPGAMGYFLGNITFVENNTLGCTDPTNVTYYIDTTIVPFGGWLDGVGDCNTFFTSDPNWFGDIKAQNYYSDPLSPGYDGTPAGWVHTYAPYGDGLFIYNGFDIDPLWSHSYPDPRIEWEGNLAKIWLMELKQPWGIHYNLPGTKPATYYDVTINAYCGTEGAYVSVSIAMDGTPTGFNTPHVFTGLRGTHTFTVLSTDTNGHPFKQWNIGETSRTITVTGEGAYAAYYGALPPSDHDVAITNIQPSRTVVAQGYSTNVNVTVANQGTFTETITLVIVRANTSVIGFQYFITLTAGSTQILIFTWDTSGFDVGNYIICAIAGHVLGETDFDDNNCTNGWITVTWLGDLDADFDVDEDDLWYFCAAFIDYYKIHVKDPLCDLDNDCDIDEDDLWTFCSAFIDYWKAH